MSLEGISQICRRRVTIEGAQNPNQILDAQIMASVDKQLASKGLTKTDGDNADLNIGANRLEFTPTTGRTGVLSEIASAVDEARTCCTRKRTS